MFWKVGSQSTRPARRSRAGDTQAGCLFTIILTIAACFVAYNYFLKDRDLKNAPADVKMLEEENPEARNNFKKKMIRAVLVDMNKSAKDLAAAFYSSKDGKLTGKDFDKRTEFLLERQREFIRAINDRAAPKKFFEAHKKAASSCHNFYLCIMHMREAKDAKTPELAKQFWKQAAEDYNHGKADLDYATANMRMDMY